jgi:AcrR family transcriptional regulator
MPTRTGPITDPPTDERPRRAAALPADERRAAILAATIPLVLEHGTAVTTRLIAEAAGVAEGTIFRVFPDKDAVVHAAIEAVFDTAPLVKALGDIDTALPFEDRLVAAVEIIQHRITRIWHLVSVVGSTTVAAERDAVLKRRGRDDLDALARLFEPDRDRLRVEPRVAAQLLRGMALAARHPSLATEVQLTPNEIATTLLDGVRGS